MNASLRYWKIWRIDLANERVGYKEFLVPLAQEFLEEQIPNWQHGNVQAALLSYFHGNHAAVDAMIRAQAGLCLRCYVSEPILKACQRIDSLFSGEKSFTYKDLLRCVLDDDGKKLVILDSDHKTHLTVNDDGQISPIAYKFFTVEVLRKFKHDSQSSMSLDNWAYFQTKQNPEIQKFLSEFGFQHLSNWALLNRVRPKQLETLSQRTRQLIEVFHAVYRRDRRQQRQIEVRRCPDPSIAQLQEMLTYLQTRDVIINTADEFKKELQQVATQLRQYDIWSSLEPLEVQNPDNGKYTLRTDLPTVSLDELDVEQQEILEFLHTQLRLALTDAIAQEISNCITKLENSSRYAPIAQKYIPGLQLYYSQGKTLKEIVPLLGMTSWDQARRVLNPGELLRKIRTLTVQKLLDSILKMAQEKELINIPPEPDYLKNLAEQIENFVDAEVFQEAGEEIRTSKNRSLDSFYAQQIRNYFEQKSVTSQKELVPFVQRYN
ncbi:hypothetical protein [Nostoc favosum]|uniref:Uncharacterized protein n=1 Tax=Nostoc favosum CHAB5714 TaxID=2780399 RepID=A0ABS8IGW4_9NOSO|nr:hypothetical protein [Nostoc favosum]MCC5603276.1 hypothetical protein [Nostoc favosum CHAB5714]